MTLSAHAYGCTHDGTAAMVLPFPIIRPRVHGTSATTIAVSERSLLRSRTPFVQQQISFAIDERKCTCVMMMAARAPTTVGAVEHGNAVANDDGDHAAALAAESAISAAEGEENNNDDDDDNDASISSSGSTTLTQSVKKAPASARRALEDARKLVKERRLNARDRHSKAVAEAVDAEGPGRDGEKALTREESDSIAYAAGEAALEAGFGLGLEAAESNGVVDVDVAVASNATAAVASSSLTASSSPKRVPRQRVVGQRSKAVGREATRYATSAAAGKGRQHRDAPRAAVVAAAATAGGSDTRGGRRGRPLPDFTSIVASDLSQTSPSSSSLTGGTDPGVKGTGSGVADDNAALVAAIQATLTATVARLDELQAKRVSKGSEGQDALGATAIVAELPEYDKPQGWLRVVGLIRRACGGEKGEDLSMTENTNTIGELQHPNLTRRDNDSGCGDGGDERVAPPPPPRLAFALALQVCVLCARPDAGLEVLSLMRSTGLQPGLDAYKAVLDGYGFSAGRLRGRAMFTVQMMTAVREAGLVPDLEMLSAAVEACSKGGNREGAMHFLDQAIRLGLSPDDRMCQEGIIAYCQSGKWLEARDLAVKWRERASTSATPAPPAVCNTALLKAMGKAGKVDEALAWLRDTAASTNDSAAVGADSQPPRSSALDHSSFLAVLSACSRAGKWEPALQVLSEMDAAGVRPDRSAYNAALAALEHRRHPPAATDIAYTAADAPNGRSRSTPPAVWPHGLQILAQMEERGVAPDIVTFNSIINILRWGGQGDLALEVLEGMNRTSGKFGREDGGGGRAEGVVGGVRPDVITYNRAIAACAAVDREPGADWKKACDLLAEMQRKGLKPDLYSYTGAIHACARAGNSSEAMRLLRAMENNQVEPDVVAMTACMDALAKSGRWSDVLKLLDEMRVKRITPNERTYQAAVQACGKGGQWQRALELLSYLEARPSGATVQEYNCAIMACVIGGEPARAVDLLEQMKLGKGGANTGPDTVSYTTAVTACGEGGMWEKALLLLEEMRAAGPNTQPNVRSYTAAITACGRAGQWKPAVELHSQLIADGFTPDRSSFNAVIGAARRGGQHKLAMQLLASMVQADLTPDAGMLMSLISSLSDLGMWQDADRVFEIATNAGAIRSSSLDGDFEVDVSRLPSAIAKVKVRSTLQRIVRRYNNALSASPSGDSKPLSDLVFITGTSGGGKLERNESDIKSRADRERGGSTAWWGGGDVKGGAGGDGGWREQRYSSRNFSLGKLLMEALRTEYDPPLRAQSTADMVGCLVVSAADLEVWVKAQGAGGERTGN